MLEKVRRKMIKYRQYKQLILIFFSFCLGFMLAGYFIPVERICEIDDSDRQFQIMQNFKLNDPQLIVLIFSAPKNLHKRTAVRNTWLKLSESHQRLGFNKFKMKHYFVIGSLGLSVDDILHLSGEQSQYSDMLILPMYDNYQNLTQKVLSSFDWLNKQYNYGLHFKYVLKCDDDSFIRLDKLQIELTKIEETYLTNELNNIKKLIESNSSPYLTMNIQLNKYSYFDEPLLYWGYFHGNARIKTSGKWKETDWIVCDRYVPYALGGAYLLSKNLVTFIANNFKNLRQFNSEDVSVGLWLAPVADILRIHDIRFDTEWTSRGCQNYYLATHNVSADIMEHYYKNIARGAELCDKEYLKRNYYLYNFNLPPSQCCNSK